MAKFTNGEISNNINDCPQFIPSSTSTGSSETGLDIVPLISPLSMDDFINTNDLTPRLESPSEMADLLSMRKYIFLYSALYSASGLSDHYFDIEKGVISNGESIVYVYDSLIHIPVIYSIPIKIEESVETMFSECDVVSVLQEIPINGGANSTNPPVRSYYTPQFFS
ncbi:hypothetical protein JTB14_018659 [Gonioctena quinquepunctata]|nr:hypothetical protein JTB14_018659 [Gonioctena quinquepunctata]